MSWKHTSVFDPLFFHDKLPKLSNANIAFMLLMVGSLATVFTLIGTGVIDFSQDTTTDPNEGHLAALSGNDHDMGTFFPTGDPDSGEVGDTTAAAIVAGSLLGLAFLMALYTFIRMLTNGPSSKATSNTSIFKNAPQGDVSQSSSILALGNQ